jgi:uncharacterized protein
MRILVISDTHIPRAAQDLPQVLYDEIKNCDMIIHAGDFSEKELYDKLASMKKIAAVYGNMDSQDLSHILGEKKIIEIERFRIGLVHGHGAPKELMETVRGQFNGVDAIVYGHAHEPTNIVKGGVLFFNPGTPTDTVFADVNTYGILEVTDKKIEGKIIKL